MRLRLPVLLATAALTAVSATSAVAAGTPAARPSAPDGVPGARIVDEQRIAPRVVELTIATTAFAAPTHVQVDLPEGYGTDPQRRWPVTYYLAGTNHTFADFNAQYGGVELSRSLRSLVVSPNGASGYWSDWYNSGSFGPPAYETFVVDQLVPLIDRHFRTTASRGTRAVTGESMGGYGVMMLAARHPDVFSAASALSGAVDSNLPANGAVLSASPTLDGGQPDAIYGPRATQEVRWRGHNPVDLAGNLRDVALQVRTGTGVLDPRLGEGPADAPGCAVEEAVHMASVDLHDALTAAGIGHLWQEYPTGCHSVANFRREIRDTFAVFAQQFATSPAAPTRFEHRAVEPAFGVWDWQVQADPQRALEFLSLRVDGPRGFTLSGSGLTSVVTAPLYRGVRRVVVTGAVQRSAVPDASGRLHLTVPLGAADSAQQYTPGATTVVTTRRVVLTPVA